MITTIIPTYKRPAFLRRAIQSVLDQTYPDFQVCIYDNASQDETARIVAEFAKKDPRVKYHAHLRNIGAAENFQYGLLRVETPFFSFLSDDDFLLPGFFETALKGFEKHPDAAFFSGGVIDVDEQGEVIEVILSKWPEKEYYEAPDGLLEMIGKYSNWIGTVFRKEVIQKIGTIDVQFKAIDIDYMLRAASKLSFAISKTPCAVFLQHSSSYSKNNGLKLIWPGWQTLIAKINQNPSLCAETRKVATQKLHADLQNLLLMNTLRNLEKKQFEDATNVAAIFNQISRQKWKKVLLSSLVEICKVFPFFQKPIVGLLVLRRFWRRRIRLAHRQIEFKKRYVA